MGPVWKPCFPAPLSTSSILRPSPDIQHVSTSGIAAAAPDKRSDKAYFAIIFKRGHIPDIQTGIAHPHRQIPPGPAPSACRIGLWPAHC